MMAKIKSPKQSTAPTKPLMAQDFGAHMALHISATQLAPLVA